MGLELPELLEFAKDYCKGDVRPAESVKKNSHMNEMTEEDFQKMDPASAKKFAEAVIVDFINYIGSRYDVALGLFTSDL